MTSGTRTCWASVVAGCNWVDRVVRWGYEMVLGGMLLALKGRGGWTRGDGIS